MVAGKRILLISSLMPGATAFYLIRELRAIGHDLAVISDIEHDYVSDVRHGIVDLPSWIARSGFQPDGVLFIEGGTRRLFPSGMEALDCPTAWYAIDTHIHPELHAHTACLFDLSFVAQREFLPLFAPSQAEWLPLAADLALYPQARLERDLDVAYVGSDNRTLHPERALLLDAIRSRYASVYLGRAEPARIGEIYSRAKVVFNKSVRNDVNMRYFEAMAAGAALLTDRTSGNGVEELFSPGVDFVEYEDESSMLASIDRLLADDAERERIGQRGKETVLAHHTYRQRAEQLAKALLACPHRVRPSPGDYLPVFHLLRFPDGVLSQALSSLSWMRSNGDRNPVLAAAILLLWPLAQVLLKGYSLRYRLRYRGVSRAGKERRG